ncbi:MAG: iron-containing alcohol dehydrogenase, partial [Solirubrobacteraceae bacterium]
MSTSTRSFSAPPYIIAGLGALDHLGAELEGLDARRVAVACDRGVEQAGLLAAVEAAMGGVPASVCALVDPDPTVEDAEHAVAQAVADGADAVLALGG